MSTKSKNKKSHPATKHDPFEGWGPRQSVMARKAYLQYAEKLAEGTEALHTIELALVKACKALPAVYRMIIPVSLGYDVAVGALEGRGIDEAEELIVPVFSQLPLLLKKVRDAGEYAETVVSNQVNCASDDPALAAFVRKNTHLPQEP